MDNSSRRNKVALVVTATMVVVLFALAATVFVLKRSSGPHEAPASTESSAPSQPSASESPHSTAPPSSAAGRAGAGTPSLTEASLQFGLIQREYLVLRPSWMKDSDKLPLVVALHGLTVDRSAMLNAADWRGEVERRGFVAVFPQGFGNSWNVGPCCPPANLLQLDDVSFLDAVIAEVSGSEHTDPQRVFMTGFSGGGLMTYRYACDRSNAVAAIGPIAAVDLTGCTPTRPLSLLHQHSDPDLVVPFDGSLGVGQLVSSVPLPPVPDSVRKWASASGCQGDTGWRSVTSGVDSMTWKGCAADTRVELVRLAGLGHEWPKTQTYDGLAVMLDFFGIR